jgi:hypothetical protein
MKVHLDSQEKASSQNRCNAQRSGYIASQPGAHNKLSWVLCLAQNSIPPQNKVFLSPMVRQGDINASASTRDASGHSIGRF